ncbi:rRNA methyltransferase [Sporosarcina sp. Sa2YVA2]|uniref:rRNA methyltransferase n=1 Tax=Sporosarcina quadrami TaxID=2762234 RepID=A0ABR8UD12_9BACL|nr:rRNA methyltransferase [Sporosarcina quadrami]MBD7985906.1 rRNA methyltransferase [Sporosarcina quadrami]
MWKLENGRLHQTVDESRIEFRTTISKTLIDELAVLAKNNNTHINYLLESGFINLLDCDTEISFDKKLRPKDRKHYKTTYDKELFEEIKTIAADNNLFINDVIEYSMQFIDVEDCKNKDYRYRIEVK